MTGLCGACSRGQHLNCSGWCYCPGCPSGDSVAPPASVAHLVGKRPVTAPVRNPAPSTRGRHADGDQSWGTADGAIAALCACAWLRDVWRFYELGARADEDDS